jgi:ankyrin repeat protein
MAVARGFSGIVDALLAAGADPNIPGHQDFTPLMAAQDVEMARCLLDHGADVNAHHPEAGTALLFAVSDANNDTSFVSLLLERGADVNASRRDGYTSLMIAVVKDRIDILKLLLAADPAVHINQQQVMGFTALFFSTAKNHLIAAKLLLEAGACPRVVSIEGHVPLMCCQTPESVTMLVDAAPDLINHACNKGRRAIGYLTSLNLLEELFASSARHNIQIDVNHEDVNGDTALHIAMMQRNGPAAVQLLLDKGAKVFGVGYGATTVLMKPFFSVENQPVIEAPEEVADSTINECLKIVMDHMLSVDMVDASVPVSASAQ